jgi:hypothetical protein
MMKSFRNVFLVTAVAATSLLGWGCSKGGEKSKSGMENQAGQQGTGGAGESKDMDQGSPGRVGGGTQGTSGEQQPVPEPDTQK